MVALLQAAVEAVEKRMPKRVKRKRRIETDDGSDAGMEEYYDCECQDAVVALSVCAWLPVAWFGGSLQWARNACHVLLCPIAEAVPGGNVWHAAQWAARLAGDGDCKLVVA